MNVQSLTTRMHAEGLTLSAQFERGQYRCAVKRNGEGVTEAHDPSLRGAVLSALYNAPMAHILDPNGQTVIRLS